MTEVKRACRRLIRSRARARARARARLVENCTPDKSSFARRIINSPTCFPFASHAFSHIALSDVRSSFCLARFSRFVPRQKDPEKRGQREMEGPSPPVEEKKTHYRVFCREKIK